MKVISNIRFFSSELLKARFQKRIGFIPTMGALHQGHISLIQSARRECDFVIVSIFVNPLQFGPQEDYQRYPRTMRQDKVLLEKNGVDVLFCPKVSEMYPGHFSTSVEESTYSKGFCAVDRPGHFKGVTTVVAKLFTIIGPCVAYFGRKDYQQTRIIEKMVQDLSFPVRLKVIPTVRDDDGLAFSSRNVYLTRSQRADACLMFQSLHAARSAIESGERDVLRIKRLMQATLRQSRQISINYLEIVDEREWCSMQKITRNAVVLVSISCGKTRLIDNMRIVLGKRKVVCFL